jgi:hypothetical protein
VVQAKRDAKDERRENEKLRRSKAGKWHHALGL